jgi:2-oxoglutarate ferredoxin oxidoreductase subunit alpha
MFAQEPSMNASQPRNTEVPVIKKTLTSAVVRFAGDSGDGVQIVGDQFTSATAMHGNDLATLPDYPAEIRAPAGTLFGVSGFQIQFGSGEVFTPGDVPDVLVAMNPAALKANLADLRKGGLVVVNLGAFTKGNLEKAGYTENPLESGLLDGYDVLSIDISKLTNAAVKPANLSSKEAGRCKNFWTLGLTYWIFNRPIESTIEWIQSKFKKRPEVVLANTLALKAGHAYGETQELFHHHYEVPAAKLPPGQYRSISGNTALAWGLLAGAARSERAIVLGSYPITPASDLLHELSKHKNLHVQTVQAEDEIAAVCVALGTSYAGSIGVTTTSGPGLALKMEAIGLAVSLELPLIVVDVQRAGPSTGLPTKTEQADLLQALYGRPGEAPVCVLAPATPSDCFDIALEAIRIATKYMTPVIVLSDATLANGAEPWRIPDVEALPDLRTNVELPPKDQFQAFARNPDTLARAWVSPGVPGYEYRVGGLEKDAVTGHVSYDPQNHETMSHLRARKIARIAEDIPLAAIECGPTKGRLLILGWGSTFGPIREAVRRARAQGVEVSHLHLRHLNPLPKNLAAILENFDDVFVPELNLGQLAQVLRSKFARPFKTYSKMQGRPLTATEIEQKIRELVSH